MTIELHPKFKKAYSKRISPTPKLVKKLAERTKLFQEDPQNSVLDDHPLKGDKIGLRAFSVTGDIRVVYLPGSGSATFLDVGSHNQVY